MLAVAGTCGRFRTWACRRGWPSVRNYPSNAVMSFPCRPGPARTRTSSPGRSRMSCVMGTSWPSRTTKLTHASPGRPVISPTVRPSAAEPALMVRWWTPLGSSRSRTPKGPGLRFDRAHLHPQQPGGGENQAVLHHDGEHHHHHHGDDAVQAPGLRYAGRQQHDAQQDRHGALEPGEQDRCARCLPAGPGSATARPARAG